MHDYSRDIMLANAQTEMEAGLAKMELNKITRDYISTIMANQSIYATNITAARNWSLHLGTSHRG